MFRLQQSFVDMNRKQYDHVMLPARTNERELEHNDTGYSSLLRCTPVDARPAAAVENETFSTKLSGMSASRCRSVDNLTRRDEVPLTSRPNYRYFCYLNLFLSCDGLQSAVLAIITLLLHCDTSVNIPSQS